MLNSLSEHQTVELINESGSLTDNLLYRLCRDNTGNWLFISHGREPYNRDIYSSQEVHIRIIGEWQVTLYDTETGKKHLIPQKKRTDTPK